MPFLTAEWRKLVFINYAIDKALLRDYTPAGTQLDIKDGKCYVSLVGFVFLDSRIKGIKIPFHTEFEEVNLRFYVKRKVENDWRRGVVFIGEIVPKPAVKYIANLFYNEHYVTAPMDHRWDEKGAHRTIEYFWKRSGHRHSIAIDADRDSVSISDDSMAAFITEHFWGYSRIDDCNTVEYRVDHPPWRQYKVRNVRINVDFEALYGPEFRELTNAEPSSVMLAEGSKISVEYKRTLRLPDH